MRVTVYHNVQEQDGRPVGMLDGWAPGHELNQVFDFEIPMDGCFASNHDVLEAVWEEFNVGTGLLAKAYRRRQLRSLSVGDVVKLDEGIERYPARYFHVARFGWTVILEADSPGTPEAAGIKVVDRD